MVAMRRRSIHQSLHPFDPSPFEVISCGSWRPAEYLQIKDGSVTTRVIAGGDTREENVFIQNLRIRSRKATLLDCTCFLRPGIDVCVLSSRERSENSYEEEENLNPVWLDAKVKTIERKRHETGCNCQFHVTLYPAKKEDSIVQIDQIFILQKLHRKPSENECYRWEYSEDCTSLLESQLYHVKFSSDLSWAVVASLYKQMNFEIKLIQTKIVYQIVEYDQNEIFLNSRGQMVALNFKVENGISVPIVIAFNPSDILEKKIKRDVDNGDFSVYDLLSLRRSKRRNIQPDRYMGCDISEISFSKAHSGTSRTFHHENTSETNAYDAGTIVIDLEDSGHCTENPVSENSTKPESEIKSREKSRNYNQTPKPRRVFPRIHEIDDTVLKKMENSGNYSEKVFADTFTKPESSTKSREKSSVVDKKAKSSNLRVKMNNYKSEENFTNARYMPKSKVSSCKKFETRRYYSIYPTEGNFFRRTRTSGSRSCSTAMFNEIMEKCVENIESNIGKEQPTAMDQWNEIQAPNSLERCGSAESLSADEGAKPEIDHLWDEMELSLASSYLLEDNKGSNVDIPVSVSDRCEQVCEHDYKVDEEIGILCQLCGHVETEIKYVLPKFLERSRWSYSKGEFHERESEHNHDENARKDFYSRNSNSSLPLSECEGNVWALIPNIRNKLLFHQKKAFEFLWRNIAGSLIPGDMHKVAKKRGGCVISHSPGAGKTFLIIAFLESYLKLFPGSRPLVLAPKTTLYTWYKEITKWDVSIPVYCIHSGSNMKSEASRNSGKSPKSNRNYLHILDCMEKIQRWVSSPSMLVMGYPSFISLTKENTNCSYKRYMARVLKESPGLLVLDEGHNPRSTRSGLRKALMRVETKLRILLSGTLFQNNFWEYFNTLALARPSFVDEILREFDTNIKGRNRRMGAQTRWLLENRARKLFFDGIAKKINAESSEERELGLNMLKKLTSGFIDVFEGGSSNSLPGLQCYSLMMKSSPLQKELLKKLGKAKPRHSGFPLELGALITLGSIHPWLIQTAPYAKEYFSCKDLDNLAKCKSEFKLGPKLKFVMSLLPRCIMKNEKVLIFCFYIAPMKLFAEIFESVFGWRKGDDFLILTGDLELFERGRIMDKFEEKGSKSKVMLASITACGEGVSLTAASRLILLDSQWNPSKTKQAIARAFRPGQEKVVYVYQLLATGTLEEDKYELTTWKEWVSSMIFSKEIAEDPSRIRGEEIEDKLLREIVEEDGASLFNMIMKNNEKAPNDDRNGK